MSANIEVPYFRVHPFYSRSPEVDYWQQRRIRRRSSVSGGTKYEPNDGGVWQKAQQCNCLLNSLIYGPEIRSLTPGVKIAFYCVGFKHTGLRTIE